MKNWPQIFLVVGLLLLAGTSGCVVTQGSSASSNASYTEDLRVFRPPVIPDEPKANASAEDSLSAVVNFQPEISYQLDSLLDSISVNNQQKKYIDGYTIQVYTGNNRTLANEIKGEVYDILVGSRPTLTYDLPNYKVKVGKYFHRMEAQKDFYAIKRKYQHAILVPQQFKIN